MNGVTTRRARAFSVLALCTGFLIFSDIPDVHAATQIVAKSSGKCVDVTGGPKAVADGIKIQQYTCTNTANQLWTLKAAPNGQVQIVASNSGKCLEVPGSSTTPAVVLQQMTCAAVPRQYFKLTSHSDGTKSIVSSVSGLCLDVNKNSLENYAAIIQYTCKIADNQKFKLTSDTSTISPPPTAAKRDPLKQPFASTSIWNTAIGSNAKFVDITLKAFPGDDKKDASMPYSDPDVIILRPDSPVTPVYQGGWKKAERCERKSTLLHANVPLPRDFIMPASNHNMAAAILLPDKRTLVHVQPFTRCTAGGYATSIMHTQNVDLYGDGIIGSHGGSRMSAIGGTLRVGELRPGQPAPKHALKLVIYMKEAYKCTSDKDCFRWPAQTADSYALGWYGHGPNNPNAGIKGLKMGALLAIPGSVNIDKLGLETEPAQKLAWTLQNYGGYVVDDSHAAQFGLNTETGPDGDFTEQFRKDYGFAFDQRVNKVASSPWVRDMQRLVQALALVDNNSASSIGGGGTPRQPAAAPLK